MIDYLNKPGKELLLDLVNDDNRATFTFEQVSFGGPEVNSMNQDERNTACLVTALPTSPWYGSVKVNYERLFFERMFVDQEIELSSNQIQNDAQLLEHLNAEYGLELEPTDVEIVGPYPESGRAGTVLMKAKPGSYVYLGELTIGFVGDKIALPDYITHTILDGFYYPPGDVSGLTKPRNAYEQRVSTNSWNEAGDSLKLDPALVGVYYANGNNTELFMAIGPDQAGRFPRVDGKYDMSSVSVENFVYTIDLQDVSHIDAGLSLLDVYDVRLRVAGATDGTPWSTEYKMVNTRGSAQWENMQDAEDFFNVDLVDQHVFQGKVNLNDRVASDATSITLAAIRKESMAPRLLAHLPFSLRAPQ